MYDATPKLEVFALDATFNRATGTIPYKSLNWNRRYYACGEFAMEVPASVYDPSWAYIYTDDRPETGIIERVTSTDDAQAPTGDDTILVQGRFLESLMAMRCFLVEKTEDYTWLQDEVWFEEYLTPNYSPRQKLYVDGAGNYAVSNDGGETIALADDGWIVPASTYNGWTEVKYRDRGYGYLSKNEGGSGYTFTTPAYTEAISDTQVVADGSGTGGVFYRDAGGYMCRQASAATAKREETITSYTVNYRPHEYQSVQTRRVKGPWQRLPANDPEASRDNLAHLMDWAQFLMGDQWYYELPTFSGTAKVLDPSLRALDDLIYQECQLEGCGILAEYSFELDKTVLRFWLGKDRTQSQTGNPFYVFSDTWGSMRGWTAVTDASNYRNTCHVMWGNAEQQTESVRYVSGFDTSTDPVTPIYTTATITSSVQERNLTTVSNGDGLAARECYLDLRGDENITTEAAAKSAGLAFLASEHPMVTEIDTGTLDTAGYMSDYDLGDKVDLAIESLGLSAEFRIVEVSETYADGVSEITITVGEQTIKRR